MPAAGPYRLFDFSGGLQSATSRLLRKRNEVLAVKNADFSYKIGAVARRLGYEQVGQTINFGNDSLGFHIFKSEGTNSSMFAVLNSVNQAQTNIYRFDTAGYWTALSLPSTVDPSTKMQFVNALNEMIVVGASGVTGNYMQTLQIDPYNTVSNNRDVYAAPSGKLIASFQGKLYIANCRVNGVTYTDRIYQSSAPTGIITYVQGPQQGLLTQLHVDSVRYIKPGMVLDFYTGGTYARQNTAVTVTWVNKVANNFGFSATQINLQDRDEVWITGRKGTSTALGYFWNVDYPTYESSDWISIPEGATADPTITGFGQNNNRLLVYTKDSMWKWDGANLIQISNQVGCVAPETVKTISNWTIWLHSTGVWGYNDMFGQLKLLSRSIQNYTQAINPGNYSTASAVVAGRKYKLAIGPLSTLDASTTSTSTSSTSSSSTSSSTSSTSTSSTSLSSTSSSSSISTTTSVSTTTSTSSTSSSISSTSASTSSTSSSTSASTSVSASTSLSTSTSSTTTLTTTTTILGSSKPARLVYDFDMNIWSVEYHTRNIRYQREYEMTGYRKTYFTDDTGKVFRDETGNTDAGDPIEFELQTGRLNFGQEQVKNYIGMYLETENARGARIMVSVAGIDENPQFQSVGQVESTIQNTTFPQNMTTGRDIDVKITHMGPGDRPVISGISIFSSLMESGYGRSVGKR